jgi:hypothetical protein
MIPDPDREGIHEDDDGAARCRSSIIWTGCRRIIYSVISIGVGFVISFFFIDEIFNFHAAAAGEARVPAAR